MVTTENGERLSPATETAAKKAAKNGTEGGFMIYCKRHLTAIQWHVLDAKDIEIMAVEIKRLHSLSLGEVKSALEEVKGTLMEISGITIPVPKPGVTSAIS